MLTLRPVFPLRAAVVAGAGAVLALVALSHLSTSAPPNGEALQKTQFRAPIAAPVAYSFAVVSGVDNFSR